MWYISLTAMWRVYIFYNIIIILLFMTRLNLEESDYEWYIYIYIYIEMSNNTYTYYFCIIYYILRMSYFGRVFFFFENSTILNIRNILCALFPVLWYNCIVYITLHCDVGTVNSFIFLFYFTLYTNFVVQCG